MLKCIKTAIFLLMASQSLVSCANLLPHDQVQTSLGVMKGTIDNENKIVKFRGIRYTEAPIGNKRFTIILIY